MYRSLMYQIFKEFPDLQTVLDGSRLKPARDGENYIWELDNLQTLFVAAIQKLGERRLTCFIDALDECEEDQIRDLVGFLEQIGRLIISSRIQFHVCLSSRHYPYITIENGIQLILEDQEDHIQDITKYLKSTLKAGSGKQFEDIKKEILQRSSGIFLWVVLVVQILNKEYDHGRIHALRRRLREIPDGLDKLFEDILTRDRENMEELILCLQWILYATRPLKREEIYCAILSATNSEVLLPKNFEDITSQDMERYILSCSKGLAEVTKLKAKTVQFIHESVRDFLFGKTGINKLKLHLDVGSSHNRLKQCCYNYMSIYFDEFWPMIEELPVAKSEKARYLRQSISERATFLEYAVHNVLYHADVADGQHFSQKSFVENFAFRKWIMLDNTFEKHQIRRHTFSASPLYIFAEKGLSNLLRIQLEMDADPDTAAERHENERHMSPLMAAMSNPNVNKVTIHALLNPKARTSSDCDVHLNAQADSGVECSYGASNLTSEKRNNIVTYKGRTLTQWAAEHGYEVIIDALFSRDSFDPNSGIRDGWTPLALAANNGHEKVVRLMLSNINTNPESTNYDGETPLLLAARNGHEKVVEMLLSDVDVNPNSQNLLKDTPLLLAARNGHEKIVEMLLSNIDVNLNSQNTYENTALLSAAENGYEKIADVLLSKLDVELNSQNIDGDTPLTLAAQNGHQKVIESLLSKEANPRLINKKGHTPLSLAAENGHEKVVNLLISEEVDHVLLLLAAGNGHKKVVDLLLSNGADPNFIHEGSFTSLSLAAENGHENIVEILLSKGADPNFINEKGYTPLLLAAGNGHEKVVESLLSAGADISFIHNKAYTALSLAIGNSHPKTAEKLLSKGADPNFVDKEGCTPLLWAAMRGYDDLVQILLSKEADPNFRNEKLYTPLLLAVTNGHERTAENLLSKGADPNFIDREGCTPLLWAARNGHGRIVENLLSKGADPDFIAKNSGTPLLWAVTNGYEKIVESLLSKNANPNRTNAGWWTPLLWAALKGNFYIASLLLSAGADPYSQNDMGNTPIWMARERGNQALVDLMLSHKKHP